MLLPIIGYSPADITCRRCASVPRDTATFGAFEAASSKMNPRTWRPLPHGRASDWSCDASVGAATVRERFAGGRHEQQLAPAPKHLRRQLRHACSVEEWVDRRLQFAHIAAVFILRAPIGNHLRRDLQVELEPVHTLTH